MTKTGSLGNAEAKELRSFMTAADEASDLLEQIESEYNDDVQAAFERMMVRVDQVNDFLLDLNDFCDKISGQLKRFYETKSDEWKASVEGLTYKAWLDDWLAASIDDIYLTDEIAPVELVLCDPGEWIKIERLTSTPEEEPGGTT